MRQRAEWMVPADDAILEYVRDAGEVPPVVIGRNVDIHSKYAGKRARTLAKAGLLNRSDDGYYSLSEQGAGYLDEEFDATEIEPPE